MDSTSQKYINLIQDTILYLKETSSLKNRILQNLIEKKSNNTDSNPLLRTNPNIKKQTIKIATDSPIVSHKTVPEAKITDKKRTHDPFVTAVEKMKAQLSTLEPGLNIIEKIPTFPSTSTPVNEQQCPIIFFLHDLAYLNFIKNIMYATYVQYNLSFTKLPVINLLEWKNWENWLQQDQKHLVIMIEDEIYLDKTLLSLYKKTNHTSLPMLGKASLLILPKINTYLQDPEKKKLLWTKLCSTIQSL